MKAEDLMIGDWVYVDPRYSYMGWPGFGLFPEELTSEHFKFWADNNMNEVDFEKFIKPIPITSKLLERNGFRRWGIHDPVCRDLVWFGRPERQEYIRVAFGIKDDVQRIMVSNYLLASSYDNIFNLHELQHVVKRWNIEKEIKYYYVPVCDFV